MIKKIQSAEQRTRKSSSDSLLRIFYFFFFTFYSTVTRKAGSVCVSAGTIWGIDLATRIRPDLHQLHLQPERSAERPSMTFFLGEKKKQKIRRVINATRRASRRRLRGNETVVPRSGKKPKQKSVLVPRYNRFFFWRVYSDKWAAVVLQPIITLRVSLGQSTEHLEE